ncbi:VanW family protein [Candidatus Margulisiibacteriota bacterium]
MRTILKILWTITIILVLATISLVSYDFIRTRQAFPPKTFIAGIDVSFLNQHEAIAKLQTFSVSDLFVPSLTLLAPTVRYSFAPEKLGVHILHKETVRNAFRMTHKANYFDELKERMVSAETFAPLVLGIDQDQLKAVLEAVGNELAASPESSYISLAEKTGGYHIEPEVIGKELNVKQSLNVFAAALDRDLTTIPVMIDDVFPRVREETLRSDPPVYKLAGYTTYYGKHDSPNRIHNIKLVSSWVDGTLLLPGEAFSVADALGDVTKEQGFKEAFVIIKSELVPLLGGGSCQIATTLYNAASLADLKVLERRNHSFYFNIYPLGRDAAVYPDQVDFKFENDTPYPILLKSSASDRSLSFAIYGTPTGKKVKFSKTEVFARTDSGRFIPSSLNEVIEKDLPFRTKVVRTVYEKMKKIKEDTILSSYKMYGDRENVPIKRPEPR